MGTGSETHTDGASEATVATPTSLARVLDVLEEGPHPRRLPQVVGNLILTSHAGLIILFGLVVLYLSGLAFEPLRPVHFAIGFALIPLLVVKLCSTGWRALRYYFGRGAYRAAGPPWLLPRLIAVPLAVAAVLATISGVVLWAEGTDHGIWAKVHKASVIALAVLALVHLAVYLRKAARASAGSLTTTAVNRPEKVIVWALLAALAAGSIATGLEPDWHPGATTTHTTEQP